MMSQQVIPAQDSIECGSAILISDSQTIARAGRWRIQLSSARRFPISDSQTIARATHWRIPWKFGAVILISDPDSDAGCSARSSSIPSRFRFEFVGELRFRFQIIIILNSAAFL